MIRLTYLIVLVLAACLAGCDRGEPSGKGKTGQRGAGQNTAQGQGKRGLNMKMRNRPKAGNNQNKKGTIPPGGGKGKQLPRRNATRLYSKGADGKAALSITENGTVIVYLLAEDSKTPRKLDVERMEIWINAEGEEKASGGLAPLKTKDGGVDATRFKSKPGLVTLGKDLQVSVIHKAGGETVAYKFRVPASYVPFEVPSKK